MFCKRFTWRPLAPNLRGVLTGIYSGRDTMRYAPRTTTFVPRRNGGT
ncbi:hypothetical protein [Caudoviricetes sp.]|nr:hypothetical protein [Caudoviricetes sp.]UOF79678.1 hypothetical protein [Caudoviricetes sp.]UOF79848.1 hypothetical protein [Bacteriophage sp.]UOF81349.1 hypothetical protein [Caudoviricetes sp.]